MTRPTPTAEIIDQLRRQIRAGSPHDVAAHLAGISPSTLSLWLRQARALRDTGRGNSEPPCPSCGALPGTPCTTRNGKTAAATHAGRPPVNPDRDPLLLTLLTVVEEAEAGAHAESIQIIRREARNGTWQAAAWYLERKYPEQYGRRTAVTHSGEVTVTVDDLAAKLEGYLAGVDDAASVDLAD